MENEFDIEKSKAFATAHFQGAQVVFQYMKDRYPLIQAVIIKPETGHREASLRGLWMRAYAWLQTITKLNDPLDYQAISAGNRALLEITVDLILLHHDKTNEAGWKMFQWKNSEKMKAAEQILNFFNEIGVSVPDQYEAQEIFCRNEKHIIDNARVALWPNKKNPGKPVHPDRWTGSSNLFPDIEKADQLFSPAIKNEIGSTLVEYYRTEYRKMNWHIHSGVASFWNMPPEFFNMASGFGFKWCADFAMLCTKIILNDFGFDIAIDGLKQEWDSIKAQRDLLYCQARGLIPE